MQVEQNVALKDKTTFGIGGAARFFISARSIEDLRGALSFAREKRLPVFLLGRGSNVLVDDRGFEGVVIRLAISGITITHSPGGAEAVAAAGESFDALVARAVGEGLWGIENLSGVPGSVGGAVVQNIGAYGAALSQSLSWVDVLDIESDTIARRSRAVCGFGYRESAFKDGRSVILRAGFELSQRASPNLTYEGLGARLDDHPPLEEIRRAILAIRRDKFPDPEKEGTAGSFFKNPIVPEKEAHAFAPDVPRFFLPEVHAYKVALAHLLDHGLHLNGLTVGGARLYERQPLVITARRGTSAADVKNLAALVARKVLDAYGIAIEREVRII